MVALLTTLLSLAAIYLSMLALDKLGRVEKHLSVMEKELDTMIRHAKSKLSR
jgi:hypothetical protein